MIYFYWHIWTILFNDASSEFWSNGVSEASGDADPKVLDGITVGANYNTASRWKGDVGELLIYDSGLSDADKNELGSYLGMRWGITYTDIS